MKNRIVIETRILFVITAIVALLTILSVWFYGSSRNNSLIENSMVSTSILFVSFFCFLSIGLYKGINVSNDLETVAKKINGITIPKFSGNIFSPEFDGGDGIIGFIGGILIWIAVTLLISAFLFLFDVVIWALVTSLIATLYWIFYRALFFVFRNSRRCKEKLVPSLGIALGYSVLYISWIYILIFALQYYRS